MKKPKKMRSSRPRKARAQDDVDGVRWVSSWP